VPTWQSTVISDVPTAPFSLARSSSSSIDRLVPWRPSLRPSEVPDDRSGAPRPYPGLPIALTLLTEQQDYPEATGVSAAIGAVARPASGAAGAWGILPRRPLAEAGFGGAARRRVIHRVVLGPRTADKARLRSRGASMRVPRLAPGMSVS
jgi:hypothetical protein